MARIKEIDVDARLAALEDALGNGRGLTLKGSPLVTRPVKGHSEQKPMRRIETETRIEECLLEIAQLCGFHKAEGARFLIVADLALEACRRAAIHRMDAGLVDEIIPDLARQLLAEMTHREIEKS